MDFSQFSPTKNNETILLQLGKLLHKIEGNTHTEPQETLEFKKTKSEQSFNSAKLLIITEKWVMGVSIIQVWYIVYSITEKTNNFLHFIPSY